MRDTYLNMLYQFAQKDSEIVSLVADNGLIVYDDFRRDFPDSISISVFRKKTCLQPPRVWQAAERFLLLIQ